MNRFVIIPPAEKPGTPEHYPFWVINDTQSELELNFHVAEIHISAPDAENSTRVLCQMFNNEAERQKSK